MSNSSSYSNFQESLLSSSGSTVQGFQKDPAIGSGLPFLVNLSAWNLCPRDTTRRLPTRHGSRDNFRIDCQELLLQILVDSENDSLLHGQPFFSFSLTDSRYDSWNRGWTLPFSSPASCSVGYSPGDEVPVHLSSLFPAFDGCLMSLVSKVNHQ